MQGNGRDESDSVYFSIPQGKTKDNPLHAKKSKYLSKLLQHPHKQKHSESRDEHQRSCSRTCSSVFFLRQYRCAMVNDARNILTTPSAYIFSDMVCTHLGSVWGQGAGRRASIRRVHPGRGAQKICMLWSSQPQLGAATVRVWFHFPSRD